jgi:hypothetical protein
MPGEWAVSGPTIAEHARLCKLEGEVLTLRRVIGYAITQGFGDGRRFVLECQIGAVIAILTEMEEAGDVCGDNAHAAAEALAAGRRAELMGTRS